MADAEKVDDFAERITTIVSKLRSLGETVEEVYVVKKILRSTSQKFIQMTSNLEQFGDLKNTSIEKIIGSLKAHEERKNCELKKEEEQVNIAEEKVEEPTLLMMESCELVHTVEIGDDHVLLNEEGDSLQKRYGEGLTTEMVWYYDTGASNHMTGSKQAFTTLDEDVRGRVRFGDGTFIEVKGKGSVKFYCKDEGKLRMENVYYIPQLQSNIISLGQLEEIGAKIVIENGFMRVFDAKGQLVAKIPRASNRLYTMTQAHSTCLLTRKDTETWNWHERYGHLNFLALKEMAMMGMVKGLPEIQQT
ncbi:PREDICTED: uncharacterized protein LOC104820084 [Tarenaya hassleriana]|uniref:uncharacterized protein LOC104820084 n=1 Tax=Tarenaya hassleriana TaxID=28532 RepID=UPI00053C3D80|nr:PREDICTED: uncharacterized protein LOC104820084 [Tarenaya hassleriana]